MKNKVLNSLRYFLDNYITKGLTRLIALLLITVVIFALLLAGLVAIVLQINFLDGFWIIINYVLYPGTGFSSIQTNIIYISFLFFSSLLGLFVTSFLISFISRSFESRLDRINSGLSAVVEKDHVLVLGFNRNMMAYFNELILANLVKDKPVIVILSEQRPDSVYSALNSYISYKHNTKIIVRRGSIDEIKDLERCSISNARTVTLMTNTDFSSMKSLLAIKRTGFVNNPDKHVSMLVQDQKSFRYYKSIIPNPVIDVAMSQFIPLIMSQTWITPRISEVYSDLLSFEGSEFYLESSSETIDRTFREVYHGVRNAIVIGVSNGETILNPDPDYRLKEDDLLICIEEDKGNLDLKIDNSLPEILPLKQSNERHKRNLGLIGCNNSVKDIIIETLKFEEYEYTFVFYLINQTQLNDIKLLTETLDFNYDYYVGDVLEDNSNIAKRIEDIDSFLVVSDERNIDKSNFDQRNLMILMMLHELENKLKTKITVTTQVQELSNLAAFNNVHQGDFIVSEVLEAQFLAQATESKETISILQELLTEFGNEIKLDTASLYFKEDDIISFETMKASLFEERIILLGLIGDHVKPQIIYENKREIHISAGLKLIVIRN